MPSALWFVSGLIVGYLLSLCKQRNNRPSSGKPPVELEIQVGQISEQEVK